MSKRVLALALGSTIVLGMVAVLTIWPVINVVETGKTPEYPDVVPRRCRPSVGCRDGRWCRPGLSKGPFRRKPPRGCSGSWTM